MRGWSGAYQAYKAAKPAGKGGAPALVDIMGFAGIPMERMHQDPSDGFLEFHHILFFRHLG
jgi:hypothetical protein